MEEKGPKHNDQGIVLPRVFNYLDGASLMIGSVIGSGIFVSPQAVLRDAGSPGMALIIWGVTGIYTLVHTLCFIELGLTYPEAGFFYTYIRHGFGEMPAFCYHWVDFIFQDAAARAVIALTFSSYFSQIFWRGCSPPDAIVKLTAGLALMILTLVQCYGTKLGVMTTNVFTIAKLTGLVVIIACGFMYLGEGHDENLEGMFEGSSGDPGSLALAILSAYWAFSGFTISLSVVEEFKEPLKKNIFKSLFIAVSVVTIVYLLANFAYLVVLSPVEILASQAVAMSFGGKIFEGLFWLMPFFVTCSTFGTLNNGILASSRQGLAAARQRHLPTPFMLISTKSLTPVPCLIFNLLSSLVLLSTSSIYTLIQYSLYIFSIGSFVAVLVLVMKRFREPELKRPFKLPMWLIFIFLFVQLALLIFPLYKRPIPSLICLACIASGLPVYYLLVKPSPQWQVKKWLLNVEAKVTYAIQKAGMSVLEDEQNAVINEAKLEHDNEAFKKD